MNKQKRFYENIFSLFLIIFLLALLFFLDRWIRPELYDAKFDFQIDKVVNGKVSTTVESLKWYDYDDVTKYYVFTGLGKLYLEGSDSYSGFYTDEKMYDDLENYLGMTCTFYVRESIWNPLETYKFEDCH